MAYRIIKASNLQVMGGKFEKAIIDEANYDLNVVNAFLKRFQDVWMKWVKARGPHLISPFLEVVGSHIFYEFLTKLFHFNPSLKVEVRKGQSNVDSQILINHVYTLEELRTLKKLKEEFDITHISDEIEIAKMMLSNCIKSITKFLSNIMNIKYRLFTSKLDGHIKKDNSLEINLIYDGRIG